MSLLKKIGMIVLKIVGIASGLMPAISQATAGNATAVAVEDKLASAFNAVITAEQMFTAAMGPDAKTGSQKLAAATPFVAALVQNIPLLSGKKPQDETKFEAACKALTSDMADLLNSYGL